MMRHQPIGLSSTKELARLNGLTALPIEPYLPRRVGNDIAMVRMGGSGSCTVAVDNQHFLPFVCNQTFTLSALAVGCTTATASALLRIGVFTATTDDKPDRLLATTAKLDCSTTGGKRGTFTPIVMQSGRVYFVAFVSSGAQPTVRGDASTATGAVFGLIGPYQSDTQNRMGIYQKVPSVSGDFDATVTSPSFGNIPIGYPAFFITVDRWGD